MNCKQTAIAGSATSGCWELCPSHRLARRLQSDQSVTQPMAHVEVDQRLAAGICAAWLPWKDDAVVAGNRLAGAGVVDLRDLPTETRAYCDEDQAQGYGFPVSGHRSEELFE